MTDMTKKLALLCTVSALTLGLAACNSTGTKTPVNPGGGTPPAGQADTSELGKARTAAKTAMDAAKAAYDAAEAEAMKAETAVMGLAVNRAAQEARDKARAAADAAKTAYEKAKAAYDKAVAATTVTAAVDARSDAEAEQKKAEAEQKTAVAQAMMAVAAAGTGIKVTYDADGTATYSLGDIEIVNDKTKRTKAGVETGEVDEIVSNAHTARDKVERDGDRLAQPAIEKRLTWKGRSVGGEDSYYFQVGRAIDSHDDKARLRLFDRYVGDGKAYIYVNSPGGESNTAGAQSNVLSVGSTLATGLDIEGDGSRPLKLRRAKGAFYYGREGGAFYTDEDTADSLVADSNKGIHQNSVDDNDGKDSDVDDAIFFVVADKKEEYGGRAYNVGERIYYRLVGNSGGKLQFRQISIREIRFPTVMAYEHMNYGMWNSLKDEDGDGDNNKLDGMGTGFVHALNGKAMTPAADMPTSGSATYKGHFVADARAGAGDEAIIKRLHGGSTTEADFSENTIETTLTDTIDTITPTNVKAPAIDFTAKLSGGKIAGNSFSGTTAEVTADTTIGGLVDGTLKGTFSGNFFGPKFEEVGGVFSFEDEEADRELRGAFGGRRDE